MEHGIGKSTAHGGEEDKGGGIRALSRG